MATTEKAKRGGPTPPYMPFRTFDNFLTDLRETGIPARIDKSVLEKKSGSVKSWLPGTLKFFDFIDKENVPTAALEKLVESDAGARKLIYAELIQAKYSDLFQSLDMSKATQSQFNSWLGDFDIKGSTINKCAAFFIDLAKASDVSISPHFRKESVPRSSSRARVRRNTQHDNGVKPSNEDQNSPPSFSDSIPALNEKLVVGLIERLPDPAGDDVFTKDKRDLWLDYARLTFQMVYGDVDE